MEGAKAGFDLPLPSPEAWRLGLWDAELWVRPSRPLAAERTGWDCGLWSGRGWGGGGGWAAESQIEMWESLNLPRWILKRAFAGAVWEISGWQSTANQEREHPDLPMPLSAIRPNISHRLMGWIMYHRGFTPERPNQTWAQSWSEWTLCLLKFSRAPTNILTAPRNEGSDLILPSDI